MDKDSKERVKREKIERRRENEVKDTGETNKTNKPGDWEQVRGGDTDNNKRAHGINKQTQESTWREQGSTRTRQGNKHVTTQGRQTQKLDTDRTQTLH